jgi:hypothetical protein
MSEDQREEREDYQREYQRGARRRQWIEHFRERQRIVREWIPICEIADWSAYSATGINVDAEKEARTLAYERLDQTARDGEFERILYLHPRMRRNGKNRRWVTREQLRYLQSIRDIAAYCWLPRKLARQWLAAHGYAWPARFDPAPPTSSAVGPIDGGTERTSGVRTNKATAAEEACGRLIAGLKQRPANKDTAFEHAKAAVVSVGPLSRKAFERAWDANSRACWKLGGRRKMSR